MRNRKSTQYLVKWKGYPSLENSWLPAKELMHAKELLENFRTHQAKIQHLVIWQEKHTPEEVRPTLLALRVQWEPKEGILSWTQSAPSQDMHKKPPSPPDPTLKPSYSQVVKAEGTRHVIVRRDKCGNNSDM